MSLVSALIQWAELHTHLEDIKETHCDPGKYVERWTTSVAADGFECFGRRQVWGSGAFAAAVHLLTKYYHERIYD